MVEESGSENTAAPQEAEISGEMVLKEPHTMTFGEFNEEYNSVMDSVSKKEKKGKLDPDSSPYVLLTEEEKVLHEKDWEQFSRNRGYSEEDIKEYDRWLTLSGQRDNLPGNINDPWRRERLFWPEKLYLEHVNYALGKGIEITSEVEKDLNDITKRYEDLSKPLGRRVGKKVAILTPPRRDSKSSLSDDIW